jgi:hypothetical protein
VTEWGQLGTPNRIKYTSDDKQRWRDLVTNDPELARLAQKSKNACAKLVAKRLGLDPAAAETIRRVI